jgi:hypothetical protein
MFQVYVGSLIEIYTTMFGWSLYNTFYDLLALTGVVYFPFLMALYHNWKKPYESQEGKAASITSQRRMQVAVISLLLAFSMAVLPVIELHMDSISFHKACSDGGSTVITEHTGGSETTVYSNNVGDDLSSTRIPLYWWLILSFSSGVNNAATSNLRCFNEIKELDQQLRNLTIKDPALRQEYALFANQCFLPAKTKFVEGLKGAYGEDFKNYVQRQYDTIIGSSGDASDPYVYIGSELYLQSPGFYNWDHFDPTNCNATVSGCSLRAQQPVPNWPYDETRDTNLSETEIAANTGMPYCGQWWDTPMNGKDGQPLALKAKLLNSVERSSTDVLNWDDDLGVIRNIRRILENAYATTYTDEELERLVISRYVDGEPPPMLDEDWRNVNASTIMPSVNGAGFGALAAVVADSAAVAEALPAVITAGTFAALDVANSLKDFYLTMFLLKSAAPFAQAVVLMMIYGLMIFYLVVSEYDIEAILLMTFLILAVRFFTPLWDIADYLDAQLYVAMYPNVTDEIATLGTQGLNRLILDMVMTVLYIAVPGIFFLIMSMAGLKLGKGVAGMDSLSSPLGSLKTSNPTSQVTKVVRSNK